jgi:RimJ/RimL family protein N-acetyltransferase
MFLLDSDSAVHRYLGNKPIKELAESHATIEYVQRQYETNGIGRWAMTDRHTGDFMGWAGLKYEISALDDRYYYDLGYRMRPLYWGKGLATEASRAWLHYGFETMQLAAIGASAHTDNKASNRILSKLGFELFATYRYEGMPCNCYRLPQAAWRDGQGQAPPVG